ncbi:glycosyltransferase [Halorientalis sp. IM1011]|uniref:glycosyltransferase n=1 Tax=Halorientalis sp. IM1011 TaxID=1932360 RepID=UPI0012F78090|nr:glycosyltransferase [Halorientalis sp. IM1011]
MTPSTLFPTPYCWFKEVPHVLLVRGWVTRDRETADSWVGPVIEQLVRMNTRLSTEVYVAFEALRERLAPYRSSRQTPVSVLPNAVDADLFTPGDGQTAREEIDVPRDEFVVGFVGTFSERHRLSTLLRASAEVDNTHLLLVGDGPRRRELETLAAELGLDSDVTFTGRIPHESVPEYISAFDVGFGVVHPGFPSNPIKCYEYLACERPVLTSTSPEFEFVAAVDAGVALDRVTTVTVADALRTLREKSNEERVRMGKRGCEYVLKNHTWDRVASVLLESATQTTGEEV